MDANQTQPHSHTNFYRRQMKTSFANESAIPNKKPEPQWKIYTVEASETRGTTALVYCLISSSLYTGTVQGWWSTPPTGLRVSGGEVHPNWSDGQQGRIQLSTIPT
jgi:hypothetical protein